MVKSDVAGDGHYALPFVIGNVNPEGPFVHVFDEMALDVVLGELDTISDFVAYLNCRHALFTTANLTIFAPGEEELLAAYMTTLDRSGMHNFVEQPVSEALVYFEEGRWDRFVESTEYKRKKNADAASYVWDKLIELMLEDGRFDDEPSPETRTGAIAPALRVLASEPRLMRRRFGGHLTEVISKRIPADSRFTRLGYSEDATTPAYVFLNLPRPSFAKSYADYRRGRREMLRACCEVARGTVGAGRQIVGIATEPGEAFAHSVDLLLCKGGETLSTVELENIKRLQTDHGLLNPKTFRARPDHGLEFPAAPRDSPAKRLMERERWRSLQRLKQSRKKLDE